MTTLHVVGCGRVAGALCRLWAEKGTFEIGTIVNRTLDSARDAVDFVGQGEARDSLPAPGGGDWLVLGVPDGEIEGVAASLRDAGHRYAVAFHLSGAEPARVLDGLAAEVVSAHPVHPFAGRAAAVERFPGSPVLVEGDAGGAESVGAAFRAIGGEVLTADLTDKRRYHAAMIAASNFLVALDGMALGLAESAGLEAGQARRLVASLQRSALANIEAEGARDALTGPIERADDATCARLAAIAGTLDDGDADLFRALARATCDLAERKHPDRAAALQAVRRRFAADGSGRRH
ncbi:MAG: DUF2520 domain-containing protein [Wenzhouxiangellaceae bacterium]|nr:DUF2520 domain-containing protein [Wenzhouxiangellaceae bacterium]